MKFQNPTIHRSKVNGRTHTQTDRQTDKPKAICPSNFFKVGGIKKGKIKTYLQEAAELHSIEVKVDYDQEKTQSERDSHSRIRGGKNLN